MNRRSFFKTVTGFVAGVCVACVPKAKSSPIEFTPSYYMPCIGKDGNLTDDWHTHAIWFTTSNNSSNDFSYKLYLDGKEVV